jgi:hypothetical protein
MVATLATSQNPLKKTLLKSEQNNQRFSLKNRK